MGKAKLGLERIKRVLLQDKTGAREDMVAVLKSDLNDLLDSYFEVEPSSIGVDVSVSDLGYYEIRIMARAQRVRGIGIGRGQ